MTSNGSKILELSRCMCCNIVLAEMGEKSTSCSCSQRTSGHALVGGAEGVDPWKRSFILSKDSNIAASL